MPYQKMSHVILNVGFMRKQTVKMSIGGGKIWRNQEFILKVVDAEEENWK